MVLKGLSSYDITDTDGELKVRSLSRGGFMAFQPTRTLSLITDRHQRKSFSVGHLRFLMKNPEIAADSVVPSLHKVRFLDDGTVKGLYEDKRHTRQATVFRNVADALNTVLVMIAASKGDLSFIYEFIEENRSQAIRLAGRTTRKYSVFLRDLREHDSEAEELFIRKVTTADIQRIKPLIALFADAYIQATLGEARMVRLDAMPAYRQERMLKVDAEDN